VELWTSSRNSNIWFRLGSLTNSQYSSEDRTYRPTEWQGAAAIHSCAIVPQHRCSMMFKFKPVGGIAQPHIFYGVGCPWIIITRRLGITFIFCGPRHLTFGCILQKNRWTSHFLWPAASVLPNFDPEQTKPRPWRWRWNFMKYNEISDLSGKGISDFWSFPVFLLGSEIHRTSQRKTWLAWSLNLASPWDALDLL
jgi:hypothetical protein